MRRRARWRRVGSSELATVTARLADWPTWQGAPPVVAADAGTHVGSAAVDTTRLLDAAVPGAVRHMFALATIESSGPEPVRVVEVKDRWAAAIVFPGRLVVPCGDARAIASAAAPSRRWRLLVGDVAAGDALLSRTPDRGGLIVHDQRFMVVDPDRVPDEAALPDPGLRRAEPADLDRLADLAVRLHVDDEFGPDPGPVGWRGYRQRLQATMSQGMVWCVGPVGAPVCKLERSVSSVRWGVQLAGIVVEPTGRSAGLGRAAVAAAVRGALREVDGERVMSLHARAANLAALTAYRAAGFVDREDWRLAVRP